MKNVALTILGVLTIGLAYAQEDAYAPVATLASANEPSTTQRPTPERFFDLDGVAENGSRKGLPKEATIAILAAATFLLVGKRR